ncbi:MAG: type II toxin-antitoxin system YafQ family toxin [Stagnimonas sp.]|nr:type II toxin-antitoxin system YafQ family toxin [Stagnimonas sp.]
MLLQSFKRDYRRLKRRPDFDTETLEYVLEQLVIGSLPAGFREHALVKKARNYAGFTECHLDADLLMIYRELPGEVRLHRLGTHVDLFGVE